MAVYLDRHTRSVLEFYLWPLGVVTPRWFDDPRSKHPACVRVWSWMRSNGLIRVRSTRPTLR